MEPIRKRILHTAFTYRLERKHLGHVDDTKNTSAQRFCFFSSLRQKTLQLFFQIISFTSNSSSFSACIDPSPVPLCPILWTTKAPEIPRRLLPICLKYSPPYQPFFLHSLASTTCPYRLILPHIQYLVGAPALHKP